MRKAAIVTFAAIVMGAAPATAGQDDQIGPLFGAADGTYIKQGYHPSGWVQRGALAQGAEARLSIPVAGGSDHSLVGVCDFNCSNLDLHLLDGSGTEISRDVEADDAPIVNSFVAKPQSYTVVVQMVTCSADSCAFGVKDYVKD